MFAPELSHIQSTEQGSYFTTTEGVVGTAFHVPVVDLEGFDLDCKISALSRITKSLPHGTILRTITRYTESDSLWFENDRSDAVAQCQYLSQKSTLIFETPEPSLWSKLRGKTTGLKHLANSLPLEELRAIGASQLSCELLQSELFLLGTGEPIRKGQFIDTGDCVTGVIRLCKQGTDKISEETLASTLSNVPLPFTVTTTIKRLPATETEFRLRSRLARQSLSADPVDLVRHQNTANDLVKTNLDGCEQFSLEWLITLQRASEQELRKDCARTASSLSVLGDVMIETVGCAPSFIATLPASPQHFTFLEYDQAVVLYLPLFAFGESNSQEDTPSPRTLVLHRQDGSLHLFDQFSGAFLAYNAIISGKTGSGKSVLANALSQSLLSDPTLRMVKIDVGGSYKKECELLGGTEITFSLDQPSGINPLRNLCSTKHLNDSIDTLSQWMSTLIREIDEKQIPRNLSVSLAAHLKNYALTNPSSPSLEDFYQNSPDFPRKSLLSRWCKGGVFENAFKSAPQTADNSFPRYRYFNFSSIQNAANPDFSEGIMAAVIAELNLEMFRIGNASDANTRLVLFCDETKFFIERNAGFFLSTTANFRKFGHGVILITQKVDTFDLAVSASRNDSGILLNSPIRFFLEQDVDRDYLKKTFALSDNHLRTVVESPYRGKDYREFVLQDDTGTRVVRLYLTPEEYWRVTSTREDNEKLISLQKHVPGLTLEEAIKCIARA
jgi:type IV secretory pathway VirB4 component